MVHMAHVVVLMFGGWKTALRPEDSAGCHLFEGGAGVVGPIDRTPAGYGVASSLYVRNTP
jgi:hypothetical protein